MASPKPLPLPPPPTEPGEFELSKDGKGWDLVTAAAEPVCAAEQASLPAQSTPALGDL
jgi:hypothetical protein